MTIAPVRPYVGAEAGYRVLRGYGIWTPGGGLRDICRGFTGKYVGLITTTAVFLVALALQLFDPAL